MGLIGRILGAGAAAKQVGEAVGGVAEVFVGNQAERDASAHARYISAQGQLGAEFTAPGSGGFDRFMNGLNRLPRPLLTLGTLSLFTYAMAEPVGFGARMEGLQLVPEPLWWLLGAIVSFYFGARELHYQRGRTTVAVSQVSSTASETAQKRGQAVAKSDDPEPILRTVLQDADLQEADGVAARTAPDATAGADAADPRHNAALAEWRNGQSTAAPPT